MCSNGLVSGERLHDLRVPHKGDVVSEVIEAAHAVAAGFRAVDDVRQAMQGCRLEEERQLAFAQAALAWGYGPFETRAPVTPAQLRAAMHATNSRSTSNSSPVGKSSVACMRRITGRAALSRRINSFSNASGCSPFTSYKFRR